MKAGHHVLIASPAAADLSAFAGRLKKLDFAVAVATTFELAERAIERTPELALVVADARSAPAEAEALVCRIKDRNRRLPVLWLGAPRKMAGQPDASVAGLDDLDALEDRAKALVIDDLYPPTLVACFASACNAALTTTFGCSVDCTLPVLSRSAVRPGNMSAFMLVIGEDTSAHLMLSADESALFALGEQIGFDASQGRRQVAVDMASEIVNQIVGTMKANSELLSSLRLALPYVFAAEGFAFYAPTPKPSLVMQLDCGIATLTADFWFATRLRESEETRRRAEELANGGLLFL